MARLPRLYAPGCPNWCKPISSSPGSAVATRAGRYPESAGHGWASPPNATGCRCTRLLANDRILLLATPADEEGLPRLMQTLGRNLAAPARRPRLRGPLPLRAARARRLGPALAGLAGNLSGAQRRVAGSRFRPWSSASSHTGNTSAPPAQWQSDHADYWACGNTRSTAGQLPQAPAGRPVARGIPTHRPAVSGQWALGGPGFIASGPHRQPPGRAGTARTSAQETSRARDSRGHS